MLSGGAPVPGSAVEALSVRELQRRLTAHGHPVAEDGLHGPLTSTAVRMFQQQRGIPGDGLAGPLTWSALREEMGAPRTT